MRKLSINGRTVEVTAADDTPLLWVVREELGLTGTKYGCGVAVCGACSVLVDGKAVRSCVFPVSAVEPTAEITTIEGLDDDLAHALRQAWQELSVPQCGYCQPGMVVAARAMLAQNPTPGEADIERHMSNLCRCGTYQMVRAAIRRAVEIRQGSA